MASPASRRELVRMFTLDSMADDCENLTVSIEGPVKRCGVDCGLTIEKAEIVDSLIELLELGWAKAVRLGGSGKPPCEFDHVPSLDEMDDPAGAWFDMTEAGRSVHMAEYDGWPFDGEGNLRADWIAPTV